MTTSQAKRVTSEYAVQRKRRTAEIGELPLLEVKNLSTYFFTRAGVVKAVDGVSLKVYRGQVLCLVGESGCGKSMTALSIMQLVDKPGKIVSGEVLLDGENLLDKTRREMAHIRGKRISMIFQEPRSSLNPVFKIGKQLAEVLYIHHGRAKKQERDAEVSGLLKEVGISDPNRRAENYPHELSGGMAQRVMIAMGLSCQPELLIADEPTTALDVTIQAQVLDLIRQLQRETQVGVVFITHDMGVVAEMADMVAVMYAGTVVEEAATETLFETPLHPYTQGLIASIPVMGETRDRLEVIPGTVPNLIDMPPGCRFASRCKARVEHGLEICTRQEPELIEVQPGHRVRCWLYEDVKHGS